jgi:hypothetical protein
MGGQLVQAVVFDVNETMIDMTPLQARMQAKGLPKDAFQASSPGHPACMQLQSPQGARAAGSSLTCSMSAQAWFAAVLRDGTTLAITDSFTTFREVGAYHMRAMLKSANVVDAEAAAEQILGALLLLAPY